MRTTNWKERFGITSVLCDSGPAAVVCRVSETQTRPRHVPQCLSSGRDTLLDAESGLKGRIRWVGTRKDCKAHEGHTTSLDLEALAT